MIVLGRDQVALDATKEAMQKQFVKDDQVCQAESLDLTDPSAVSMINHVYMSKDSQLTGNIQVLQFIAGVTIIPTAMICVAGGTAEEVGFFADIPAEAIANCMTKNYLTSALIAQALLKRWISVPAPNPPKPPAKRHLVFTASTAALVNVPGYAAYSPTKAALRCLTDSLRQEVLMYHACADIKVHCSFPGTIYTESFYKEQDMKPRLCKEIEGTLENQGGMSAEEVASSILSGLEKGQSYLTSDFQTRLLLDNMRGPSPLDSPLLDWLLGFLMSLVWPFVRRGIDRKVYQHKP